MMELKDPIEVPPGGWWYRVAATDTIITAQSLTGLVGGVINHMSTNNVFIPPNIDERIQHQICQRVPPEKCRIRVPEWLNAQTRLTIGQVIAGTTTVASWLLKGKPMVSREEADRRAAICMRCDANQDAQDCSSCAGNQVRKIVENLLKEETSYDGHLKYCISCGCALKVSVWVPLEIQQRHMPKSVADRLPPECWKKKHDHTSPGSTPEDIAKQQAALDAD